MNRTSAAYTYWTSSAKGRSCGPPTIRTPPAHGPTRKPSSSVRRRIFRKVRSRLSCETTPQICTASARSKVRGYKDGWSDLLDGSVGKGVTPANVGRRGQCRRRGSILGRVWLRRFDRNEVERRPQRTAHGTSRHNQAGKARRCAALQHADDPAQL